MHALRDRLQIPGMSVLQFGFGDEGAHMYLPHRSAGKVIYTGTHDNDTVAGWWHSGAADHERRNAEAYLGRCDDGIHWAFIRAAQCSPASLSVIPLQDVLGSGQRGANEHSQPAWRQLALAFRRGQLNSGLAAKLALLAELSDRIPEPLLPRPGESYIA